MQRMAAAAAINLSVCGAVGVAESRSRPPIKPVGLSGAAARTVGRRDVDDGAAGIAKFLIGLLVGRRPVGDWLILALRHGGARL